MAKTLILIDPAKWPDVLPKFDQDVASFGELGIRPFARLLLAIRALESNDTRAIIDKLRSL